MRRGVDLCHKKAVSDFSNTAWCPGQESNLHALRHTHLKRARLPIPPPGHFGFAGAKVVKKMQPASEKRKKVLFVQEFELEQQQIDHRHRNIGIGKVKDRPEEVVVVIDQERQKIGAAIPAEEREVEHIDHLTHHRIGIVAAKVCHGERGRFREDQPIEGRVEDVAHRTGKDQCAADQDPLGCVLLARKAHHDPRNHGREDDAEDPQRQLAPIVALARSNAHTKCRARVFDEAQLEPIGADDDRLAQREVGFDPDFECLVGHKQQQNQQGEFFPIHGDKGSESRVHCQKNRGKSARARMRSRRDGGVGGFSLSVAEGMKPNGIPRNHKYT